MGTPEFQLTLEICYKLSKNNRISHFLDDVYNEDLGDNPPADDENIAPADYENITPADKEDTTPATQADTSSIRAEDEGTAPTNNQVTTQADDEDSTKPSCQQKQCYS
ncbi:hypothetical protein LSTR_LSTR014675 [Laodelphax striatellus]|uniref:Uncharacterized protein n=1 Tax=Laodelphax striatellus TaxID=195883 RepID=A0A482X074_LAOST|nr:hypothetical protein LSTR_LSTR014675 [Laodelphax striatellus]